MRHLPHITGSRADPIRGSTTRRAPAHTCSPANEPVIFTSSPIRKGCSHLLRAGRVIERRESRNERRTLVKPPGNGNAASPLRVSPFFRASSFRPESSCSSSSSSSRLSPFFLPRLVFPRRIISKFYDSSPFSRRLSFFVTSIVCLPVLRNAPSMYDTIKSFSLSLSLFFCAISYVMGDL